MISLDPVFPFNNDNVGPAVLGQPFYPGLITPSFFNDSGVLTTNSKGDVVTTSIGYGTEHPIGISPLAAYDMCFNVKCMYYKVHAAWNSETGDDIFSYGTTDQLGVSGIIRRLFVSSGSIFKYKFRSLNTKGTAKSMTDDVLIDFTKAFYDLRNATGLPRGFYWFPQIVFKMAGPTGSITGGTDMSTPISFSNFGGYGNYVIPSIPLQVETSTGGIVIDAAFDDRDILQTERYDMITFSPQHGAPGTNVTITIPPYDKTRDSTGFRDGFADVTEVKFRGAPTVTDFVKSKSGKASDAVTDTITVTVPPGAKTDVISFTSVADPSKADTTTDYYTTYTPFKVD